MRLLLCQISNVWYNKIIFLYKDLQTVHIAQLLFIFTKEKIELFKIKKYIN